MYALPLTNKLNQVDLIHYTNDVGESAILAVNILSVI